MNNIDYDQIKKELDRIQDEIDELKRNNQSQSHSFHIPADELYMICATIVLVAMILSNA